MPYTVDIERMAQKDIAYVFQVSTAAVRQWLNADMPRRKDKKYDLRDVIQWRIESKAKLSGTRASQQALTKLRDEQGRIARLKRMEKEGKLVDREAVTKSIQKSIVAAKTRLTGLQATLTGRIIEECGVDMSTEIQTIINEALKDLASTK